MAPSPARGERTVYPFQAFAGSYFVVPVGNTEGAAHTIAAIMARLDNLCARVIFVFPGNDITCEGRAIGHGAAG
jgi:hypothetical protein